MVFEGAHTDDGLCLTAQALPPKRWQALRCKVTFPGYDATRDCSFDLVPRIIGRHGANLKSVCMLCEGSVHIRGHGSNHVDGKSDQDSLHILLICHSNEQLQVGKQALERTLNLVTQHFRRYSRKKNMRSEGVFYSMCDF